jgi:hypothetical protein
LLLLDLLMCLLLVLAEVALEQTTQVAAVVAVVGRSLLRMGTFFRLERTRSPLVVRVLAASVTLLAQREEPPLLLG